MKWNEYFSRIKQGDIRQVYLFTGCEDFVKREALEKLREHCCPLVLRRLTKPYWKAFLPKR